MSDFPVTVIRCSTSSDEKFQSALSAFPNQLIFSSPVAAIQDLERQHAHVVIIECDIDEMSGIEVTEAIRDIDSENYHFTYIILVGDAPDTELLGEFSNTLDCHAPADDPEFLRACILAGGRLSDQINELTRMSVDLRRQVMNLQTGQLRHPGTGLGNRKFAEQTLGDAIRHIESRGGAVCLLLISVTNMQDVIEQRDEKIGNEYIADIAKRLVGIVRPMDTVTYFNEGQFGVVFAQPTLAQCDAECYQHIFDGINNKAYKTSIGYIDAEIAISLTETGPPNTDTLITAATSKLELAKTAQKIAVTHLGV